MLKLKFSSIVILSVVLLLSILSFAYGHGSVDVVNNPEGNYVPRVNVGESLYQSFVPTASELWSVDLRIYSELGSGTAMVRIREGSPGTQWYGDTILGEASAFVETYEQLGGYGGAFVHFEHFDFPSPIPTTPGSTYVIELVWLGSADLIWVGNHDNPYPDGMLFNIYGSDLFDCNFITYGPEAEGVPEFEAPTALMVSVAMLTIFLLRRTRLQPHSP